VADTETSDTMRQRRRHLSQNMLVLFLLLAVMFCRARWTQALLG